MFIDKSRLRPSHLRRVGDRNVLIPPSTTIFPRRLRNDPTQTFSNYNGSDAIEARDLRSFYAQRVIERNRVFR